MYEQLDDYTSLKGVLDVKPYIEKAKSHLGADKRTWRLVKGLISKSEYEAKKKEY